MFDKEPDETEDEYYARVTEQFREEIASAAEGTGSEAFKYLVRMVDGLSTSGLSRFEAIQFVGTFYAVFYVSTSPSGE